MENAQVAIFEPDEDIRHYTRLRLERDGHHVTAEAGPLEAANAAIDSFEEGAIDVVLTVNYGGMLDNRVGNRVIEDIRRRLGSVTIIDTSFKMADGTRMKGTDINIEKVEPDKIVAYINDL